MEKENAVVRSPWAYLERDHKTVAELMEKIEKSSENAVETRERLFTEIEEALSLHMELEETIIYPALEKVKVTHDITLEGEAEHEAAKMLMVELHSMPKGSEQWLAKFKVFKENIEHHVREEEGTMFPDARKALLDDEERELAAEMEAFLTSV